MIKKFSLENFRVFKDKTTFKLKPITILTGPNNSGKSSVNKALLLLHENLGNLVYMDGIPMLPANFKFHGANHRLASLQNVKSKNSKSDAVCFCLSLDLGHEDHNLELHLTLQKDKSHPNENYVSNIKIKYNDLIILENNNTRPRLSFIDNAVAWLNCKINYSNWVVLFMFLKKNYIVTKDTSNKEKNKLDNFVDLLIFGEDKFARAAQNIIAENDFDKLSLFSNDFIFSTLLNETNYPYKTQSLIDLLTNNGIRVEQNEKILAYLNRLPDFINYLIENKFHPNTLQNEILSFINENEMIVPLHKSEHSSSRFILTNFNLSSYHRDKLSPSSIAILTIYHDLIAIGLDDNHLKFSNLLEFIKTFTWALFENISIKFKSIDYLPHTNLPNSRAIPLKGFDSRLVDNLLKFKNKCLGIAFTVRDIYEGNDSTMYDAYLEELNLEHYDIIPEIDENNENLNIYLKNRNDLTKIHISDLGSGINHIVSLITLLSIKEYDQGKVIIEEPESNLHPKLQSKLADLFTSFINVFKSSSLLIETHSEYLIRKLQFLIAKGKCNPEDVVIYYIDDPDPQKRQPNAPQVREITIDKYGRMSQDFGIGFFDEADNIAIQLFNHNQQSQN